MDPADAAMVAQWDAFRQLKGIRKSPYRDMVDLLQKQGGPQRSLTPVMNEFLQGLTLHQPLFAQITDALQRPSCRWPDMGSRHQLTTLQFTHNEASAEMSVVRVNNVWRCLAVQEALEGDMDGALRQAARAGDLHRILQGQGTLLNFLIEGSLLDSEVDLIGNILRHVPAQPASYLAAADQLSQRPGLFGQYPAVLMRERIWAIAVGTAMMDSGELAKMMGGFTTKLSIWGQQKVGRLLMPGGWQKQVVAAQLHLLSERLKAHDPALSPLERVGRDCLR